MLKIDRAEPGPTTVLRLEGRVVGPWVDALREACEAALCQGGGVTVDLAGVAFVDHEGLSLLQRLRHRDVVLSNCSPFLSAQLGEWAP